MSGEIEVTIETLIHGGNGLARHEGRVIFVPYTLPGERVRVRLGRQRKGWAEAELIEVLAPSPERVEPRCQHFGAGRCGGCQWQHMSYPAQLQAKSEIVRDQLRRIGKFPDPPVRLCLGESDDPWHYRNHVQLAVDEGGNLGFVSTDGRRVYPIDVCYIMNPAVYDLFNFFEREQGNVADEEGISDPDPTPDLPAGVRRLVLRGSFRTASKMVIVEHEAGHPLPQPTLQQWGAALGPNVSLGQRHSLQDSEAESWGTAMLGGPPALTELFGARRWTINPDSFFQTNTAAAETLLRVVRDFLGPLHGTERLLDAFAGVGTFGLSLAPQVGQLWHVESHPAAVADARQNAEGLAHVEFLEGRAEEVLPGWLATYPRPDLILLDPPRAGCEPPLLAALAEIAAPRIVYVSCDPATLARDLRVLAESGYTLSAVQPVDLFPQTFHIETVALLERPAA